ncbi:uncharacterized protein F4807DRAFT_459982 [Annulohypoxylon truncatum]|uniref:uncharacterized protein n=1 Tax=Annulohypoxylon truncatum TaxID=327061 RepID=UPI0020076DED|nr:uncharacterized protein F4807DRAFT_459982 [Annulohypoxylon truncatum]KAI1210151.1 hypothetical protein F4807DRAFT_459982 [Annulohypoxylon truncatum]
MPHSHPRIESGQATPHARPDFNIDNVKTLRSNMITPQSQLSRTPAESSGRSPPFADDREPLLGRADMRDSTDSWGTRTIKYSRKRSCDCGLPIIVFCRLFNTVFAACTIDKANNDVGDGWNLRIYKLLFDFCWIILVWNIFAFVASIFSCAFFPIPVREKEGSRTGRDFRDKMRIQFACNDAVLGVITLVLLVVACHGIDPSWEGQFVGLMPPVVAMVASLVTVELLVAMIQPFRYSESRLFSITWRSEISQFRTVTT